MNTDSLLTNKKSWDDVAPRFFGRNPLPEYGPFAPLEGDLNLLGDVAGKNVLEIGCGSGHSLKYMEERNARELWGMDLSSTQIETAKTLLRGTNVRLYESPMEHDPGLPQEYFDIVYSIYALGWTTNLDMTLKNINNYLRPGGYFIFSWEHPFYSRVKNTEDGLIMNKSYHEEGPYEHEAWNHPAIMQQFKISTYINSLVGNGFKINQVIEDLHISDQLKQRHENRWYNCTKAMAIPTTIIFKCEKV